MVSDPASDLLVCGISGRCFDRWVTPAEEEEAGAQVGGTLCSFLRVSLFLHLYSKACQDANG